MTGISYLLVVCCRMWHWSQCVFPHPCMPVCPWPYKGSLPLRWTQWPWGSRMPAQHSHPHSHRIPWHSLPSVVHSVQLALLKKPKLPTNPILGPNDVTSYHAVTERNEFWSTYGNLFVAIQYARSFIVVSKLAWSDEVLWARKLQAGNLLY